MSLTATSVRSSNSLFIASRPSPCWNYIGKQLGGKGEGLPGGTQARNTSLPTDYGLQFGLQSRHHQVSQDASPEDGLLKAPAGAN